MASSPHAAGPSPVVGLPGREEFTLSPETAEAELKEASGDIGYLTIRDADNKEHIYKIECFLKDKPVPIEKKAAWDALSKSLYPILKQAVLSPEQGKKFIDIDLKENEFSLYDSLAGKATKIPFSKLTPAEKKTVETAAKILSTQIASLFQNPNTFENAARLESRKAFAIARKVTFFATHPIQYYLDQIDPSETDNHFYIQLVKCGLKSLDLIQAQQSLDKIFETSLQERNTNPIPGELSYASAAQTVKEFTDSLPTNYTAGIKIGDAIDGIRFIIKKEGDKVNILHLFGEKTSENEQTEPYLSELTINEFRSFMSTFGNDKNLYCSTLPPPAAPAGSPNPSP